MGRAVEPGRDGGRGGAAAPHDPGEHLAGAPRAGALGVAGAARAVAELAPARAGMGEVAALEHVGGVAGCRKVELGVGAQSTHVATGSDSRDLAEQRVAHQRGSGLVREVAVGARRPGGGLDGLWAERHRRSGQADADTAPARLDEPPARLALVGARRRSADTEDGEDGEEPQCQPSCQEDHHDAALVPDVHGTEPHPSESIQTAWSSWRQTTGFASDNHAGVHPEVMDAIAAANDGHAGAYGADPWTARAAQRFREHFGAAAHAFPVFNGTGANVLCLEALTQRWQAIVCARTAHLHVDECGAPERAGRKLLVVDTPDGRLTPELIEPLLVRIGDEHAVQPRVVSIAQSTELGTVYPPEAIAALADWAHGHGMLLHVDGSRLCNAAAALDVPLRALTTDAGVDAVSFGGTKNGLMGAEAVVLLREDVGRELQVPCASRRCSSPRRCGT